MATDLIVTVRMGTPVHLIFGDEEDWRVEDRDKLIFVLGQDKVVRGVFNVTDFVHAVAVQVQGGDDN